VDAFDALPPEDRERTNQTIAECIANQAPYSIEISLRHARQYWRDGFGRSTEHFTTQRASRIALKLTPNTTRFILQCVPPTRHIVLTTKLLSLTRSMICFLRRRKTLRMYAKARVSR